VATHDDARKPSGGYSDEGFHQGPTSGAGGGAHHFDDTRATGDTAAFDTAAFDTAGYTPPGYTPDATGYTPIDTSTPPGRPAHRAEDGREPPRWTGSADLGLLVLRLALGGAFLGHGLRNLFGLFGGVGVDAFAGNLADLGYRQERILAWVAGIAELVGGGLLVLGLFTPLAAAAVLGVVANAIAQKYGADPFPAEGVRHFLTPEGVEQEVAYAAMAFALLFTGPGRAALDRDRGWFRHPLPAGVLCLLLAAGAATTTLLVFHD